MCKILDKASEEESCYELSIRYALDLINRQKAEIERLKKCVAILKDEVGKRERGYDPSEEIDNLLKETVGEDK